MPKKLTQSNMRNLLYEGSSVATSVYTAQIDGAQSITDQQVAAGTSNDDLHVVHSVTGQHSTETP